MLPKDVNDLLVAMHHNEPLEVALRSGNAATPERQAFIPQNMSGQILVLWSERFAANLQRGYVANGRIILRLTCGKAGTKPVSNEEEMQVEGDRDLASSHPVLQKMNPCVGEMVWLFSGEQ